MSKIKTYVLTVSSVFPTNHKRKGQYTGFIARIKRALCRMYDNGCCQTDCGIYGYSVKIHTIRRNFDLWDKRIKDVQDGKAVLSLRYWSDRPYHSNQVEFAKLDKNSGVGVQMIDFSDDYLYTVRIDGQRHPFSSNLIAEHDGLSNSDFEEWFKNYDLSKPMAIIHFTNFRY